MRKLITTLAVAASLVGVAPAVAHAQTIARCQDQLLGYYGSDNDKHAFGVANGLTFDYFYSFSWNTNGNIDGHALYHDSFGNPFGVITWCPGTYFYGDNRDWVRWPS